jgi:hypothetical protein
MFGRSAGWDVTPWTLPQCVAMTPSTDVEQGFDHELIVRSARDRASIECPRWRLAQGRLPDIAAVLLLLVGALAIYGRYATKGGWFYDDWRTYAELRDQHGGFFAELKACTRTIPGGRTLACVYHAGEYHLFVGHRRAYQFASIAFLVFDAALLYAIALRARLARPWAFLLAAAFVLFPASDSARLWDVASLAGYDMALVLGAIVASLSALGGQGRPAFALHVLGAVLAVVAMATYEIALPLIALGGVTYCLAYRNRAALLRWGVDVGLVVLFLAYRLILAPLSAESGFLVHRSAAQTLSRAWVLLNGAWVTWKDVYAPGGLGTIVLVVVAAVVIALAVCSQAFRRRATRWVILFAFGLVLSAAGALVYLTANDLYVPVVDSIFNRLNVPGSFGYAAMAVAVLGATYEVLRALRLPSPVVALLLALPIAASTVHQLGISDEHIRSWEASWNDQQQALHGYRIALRHVPRRSEIIGFDVPIWERGFVPVFAAGWDLRGAIDWETAVNPPVAYPLVPTLTCGRAGVVEGTAVIASYAQPGEPLYFVSPKRRAAVRVTMQRTCEQTIAKWGRPPFWGSTVTGVPFTV